MVSAQTSICPGEWNAWNYLVFWDTKRSPNTCQWLLTKKEENLSISGQQSENHRKWELKMLLGWEGDGVFLWCDGVFLWCDTRPFVWDTEWESNWLVQSSLLTITSHEKPKFVINALGSGAGRFGNWKTSWDHPNKRIIEIGQNTENNPIVITVHN